RALESTRGRARSGGSVIARSGGRGCRRRALGHGDVGGGGRRTRCVVIVVSGRLRCLFRILGFVLVVRRSGGRITRAAAPLRRRAGPHRDSRDPHATPPNPPLHCAEDITLARTLFPARTIELFSRETGVRCSTDTTCDRPAYAMSSTRSCRAAATETFPIAGRWVSRSRDPAPPRTGVPSAAREFGNPGDIDVTDSTPLHHAFLRNRTALPCVWVARSCLFLALSACTPGPNPPAADAGDDDDRGSSSGDSAETRNDDGSDGDHDTGASTSTTGNGGTTTSSTSADATSTTSTLVTTGDDSESGTPSSTTGDDETGGDPPPPCTPQ